MAKAKLPWALVLIVVATGFMAFRKKPVATSPPTVVKQVTSPTNSVRPGQPARKPTVAVAPAALPPAKLTTPTTQALRDEVANDPHLPPPSYLRFATELGQRLSLAEESEAQAAQFVDELDDCLMDRNQAESVRSLCLASARRLAEKYNALKRRVAEMFESAGPRIAKLAR